MLNVKVQSVLADRTASADVKMMLAEAVPEPDIAAVNVVDPQPLGDTEREFDIVKLGSLRVMVSDMLRATLRANNNETAEAAPVTGLAIVKRDRDRVG